MIRNIMHIGVLVRDLDAAARQWEENLGFKQVHRADIEAEGVRTVLMTPSGSPGETGVELMEPIDKADMSNPIARRLAQAGEGFFHLAVTVNNTGAARQALLARGVAPIELAPVPLGRGFRGIVDPSALRQLVPPKSSNGVLIELAQAAS